MAGGQVGEKADGRLALGAQFPELGPPAGDGLANDGDKKQGKRVMESPLSRNKRCIP
jgi:hypothetical protein